MFQTILRNLILNAIKFTNKNDNIEIFAEKKLHKIIISVADNGVGISAENQAKLWDNKKPFSTQGTENEDGTGFGLLLCKEFVEKHDGQIWVKSEKNSGTTFFFTMPQFDK
jgi:signal transduction histidine kinase